MHTLVYALVEGSSSAEALETARTVFDRLTGITPEYAPVFDYYVTFDDHSSSVAGPARWGHLPAAARLDEADGEALLERGWTHTREEFERSLTNLRACLSELDDDAVMRDEQFCRYYCYRLGALRGPMIALYDEYGEGIRDSEERDRVLDRLEQGWIVPADVHF